MEIIFVVLAVIIILLVHSKIMSDNTIVDIVTIIGEWAVVTGATDGIGKSFAFELARMGYSIVLVSRNEEKLKGTASEIQNQFKVSTKIIQADFTSLDKEMYSRLQSELQDMDIGILVNNVGICCTHPEEFLEFEKHLGLSYQAMLNVNISSLLHMTCFVLPQMVKKGKGLIINVSSQASMLPTPLYTVYGATKSFVTKFSQDLDTEYRGKGVNIHVLTTGLVKTKLSGIEKTSFFGPSPQTYVVNALKKVTRERRCDGYIGHALVSFVMSIANSVIPEITSNFIFKTLSYGKRKRANQCEVCRSNKGK